jgi:hypothetical protein
MTLAQFTLATGSDLKWLQNASAILGRDLHRTPMEAKLWALIRLLVSTLEMPLRKALEIARSALEIEKVGVEVVVHPTESRVASVVIDLNRFESVFNANLSAALILDGPKRRGRPKAVEGDPLEHAKEYGIDLSLLQSALALPVATRLERLDSNAQFLRELRASR